MKTYNGKKIIYFIISAILAVCPFVITYTSEDGIIYTPMIAESPQHLEMEKGCIVFFGILFLIAAAARFVWLNKRKKRLAIGLAVFFSLCTVFGKSYQQTASWGYIFSSFSGFTAAVCMIAGYSIMFYYAVGALICFIDKYDDIAAKNNIIKSINKRTDDFLKSRSLLKMWIILMIFWLPYIIINYPAVIHADSGVMLSEYLGNNLYNHHPVVQTVIWGSFVKFGYNVFGSYNIGVFLFAFIQYVYETFIFALLFNYVYKKGGGYPTFIILLSYIVVATMPAFSRYATSVCKDSNYSFYLLFMVWLMFKTVDFKDAIWNEKNKRIYLIIWVITILFVCFARKNGVYTVILTVPFLLIYLRKNKRAFVSVLISILLGLGLYYAGEYAIANVWDIGNDDTKEIYSIQYQQTARFVRDYGEDVEPKERDAINAILDYDSLAEKYNPELVDPVKNTFNFDSTDEDFRKYLGVWFEMFFKHPTVYIQATLNNVYGYFYPEDIGYYKDLFFMTQCVDENKIFSPEPLKEASEKLCEINMSTRKLPVIGLFSSMGFFVWLDIFIMLYFMMFKKDKKFAVYNLPAIISLLICIAGPANNTMRYGLPIIYISPILICMCFKSKNEAKEVKK